MTKGSSQGFSKPILVVFLCTLFFVSYFMYHIHVECCIKIYYLCILAFVLYFHLYMLKKKKFISCILFWKKQKYFSGISSWHIFIIYMGLRHFCLHAGTKNYWILRHSFLSIDQASTCPTVGARCYQLFCTIVGLPEEPSVDKHVQCLILVYQLIRLCV